MCRSMTPEPEQSAATAAAKEEGKLGRERGVRMRETHEDPAADAAFSPNPPTAVVTASSEGDITPVGSFALSVGSTLTEPLGRVNYEGCLDTATCASTDESAEVEKTSPRISPYTSVGSCLSSSSRSSRSSSGNTLRGVLLHAPQGTAQGTRKQVTFAVVPEGAPDGTKSRRGSAAVPKSAPMPAASRAELQAAAIEELDGRAIPLTADAFYEALNAGHLGLLKTMVRANHLPSHVLGNALCAASEIGREPVVTQLVEAGIDVNTPREDGTTALICAAQHYHETLCIKLVTHYSAGINVANDRGVTSMIASTAAGRGGLCRLLLRLGGDAAATKHNGSTVLMSAALTGDTELCRDLLARGANVNAGNDAGARAIVLAAERGDVKLCKLFIANGADVNVAADDGTTALMAAARNGHGEVCTVLAEAGANVDTARAVDGWTALMLAANAGYDGACGALLRMGCDVDMRKSGGWTALMICAQHSHVATCGMLLRHGADPNATKEGGWTPLMIAAKHGHNRCCRELLQKGADPTLTRADGSTAQTIARAKKHWQVVEELAAGRVRDDNKCCIVM